MGLTRIFGLCLGLVAIGEAFVEFGKSRLYDESDFEGVDTILIPNYCSPGCQIYVSIPDGSVDVADNIKLEAFQLDQRSITYVNTKDDDGRIIPYAVKEGNHQVNLINENPNAISAPLAVWIVRNDNDFTTSGKRVEVYDAAGTIRNSAPASFITILETEPYALSVDNDGAPFNFQVTTSGFDALGEADGCKRVVDGAKLEDDFIASVRSPLLTLNLAESGEAEIRLTAHKNNFVNLDQSKTTFVTSPGYIGCNVKTDAGKTKTFRSSLYEVTTEYDFASHKAVSFELRSWINLDANHPVAIVADDQPAIMWGDAALGPDDATKSTSLTAKDLKITWARNGANLNEYFMIRVTPDDGEEPKTTTPEPVQTTTPGPVKTTTNEPNDPARTTSDLEDVKTTSGSEPIQTTSGQQPEPAKSTTTVTVPLETTTSDSEPEPVKTTTNSGPGPDHETTTTTDDSDNEHSTTEPMPTRRSTATRRTLPTTTFHPKSTFTMPLITTPSTTTTTTVKPTTSGAFFGSLLLPVLISSAMIFA